jgi:hypothetical protein
VPDVFYYCCVLYNLTIRKGFVNIEELMRRIVLEAKEEVCIPDFIPLDFLSSALSSN